MALPVFRAATAKQTASGGNSVTVPSPSGIQAGDLDILVAINTAAAGAPSISAGGSNYTNFVPGGFHFVTGGRVFVAWYRIYQATDTDPDIVDGGANGVHGMRFCIQAGTFSRTSPFEMITEGGEETVDASMSWAVGASTSGPERLVYAIYTISRDSNTASTPACTNTSLTNVAGRYNACTNVGGGGGFGITEGARATAGTAGTFECTYATTSAKVFFAFAVKPEYPPTIVPNTADAYNFGTDTTPTLEFTGSDQNADDLTYEVQIGTDGNFYSGVGDYLDSQMGFTAYTALLTNNVHVGQAFNAQGGGQLTAVRFYMQKIGSATGSMYAELYAASGTFPNVTAMGSALAVSNSYDASTVSASGGIIPFTFSGGNQYQLQPNTNYVIFVYHGSGDGSNYVQAGYNPNNPHYGNYVSGAEGTWGTEPTRDAWFAVSTNHGVTLQLDKLSASHAGFLNTVNGADTNPFTAGDKISFTVQEADALTSGTWYWRARVKDPGGSNAWTAWTTTRTFTVSGGIVGTLSQTLGELTASGAGVVVTHGTATPLLGALTTTTDVDVSNLTDLDQSLDALTATSDVDAVAGADLDQSLDAATVSADATVANAPIIGTLAVELGAASISSDADALVSAETDTSLGEATVSAEADTTITADTATELGAATIAAETDVVVTGAATNDLGALTVACTATVGSAPITADLTQELGAAAVDSDAAALITATQNSTLGVLSASAAAVVSVAASTDVSLGAATLEATASLIPVITGSLSQSLDALTVTADADAIAAAALAQSLGSISITLDAVTVVGAATDASLGALTGTAEAVVSVGANANITLGTLTVVCDASTGYSDINASVNVILDALTSATDADVRVIASAVNSLGALAVTVDAGPIVTGATSATLGALTGAGSADAIVGAAANPTLGGLGLASEADVSALANLSAILGILTVNSTASTINRIICDLDKVLGALVIASTCKVRVKSTTIYALDALTGSATARAIVGARVIRTLGAVTGSGTGTSTVTATVDVRLAPVPHAISVSVSITADLDEQLDPVTGAVYVMPQVNVLSHVGGTLTATKARGTLKVIKTALEELT